MQVQLKENCREADVFVIQPLVPPVHDNLMELLQMLDAARGASASRVTAVIPYYGYGRSDQKDAPRISIAGRLTADVLITAGANRIIAMTLHAAQVHGFFGVPVDHLNALDILATHFRDRMSQMPSSSLPTSAGPRTRRTLDVYSAYLLRQEISDASPTPRSLSTPS